METGADHIRSHRRALISQLDEHVRKISLSGAEPAIDEVRLFLQQELMPLVEAGEADLMPAVERVTTPSPGPSTMSLDLAAIRRYVGDIEEIMYTLETGASSDERDQLKLELMKKTIRLQAVVELYTEKESEVFLPALESQLPEEERQRVAHALVAGRRVVKLPDSERV